MGGLAASSVLRGRKEGTGGFVCPLFQCTKNLYRRPEKSRRHVCSAIIFWPAVASFGMRARQLSNVSSSTPAAIRVWLVDFGWLMALDSEAGVPDICGPVAVDSVAAVADIVGLDTAGFGVGPPEDSIVFFFLLIRQPPRMSPKKIIQ